MKKSTIAIALLICGIGGAIGISQLSRPSQTNLTTTPQPTAQSNVRNKQSSTSGTSSSTSNSLTHTPSKQEATPNRTVTPAAQQSPKASTQSYETCKIKGNISYRTGERIYHLPGQKYYASTQIDTTQGERWFCTEQEAQSAGWRKSKI